MNKNKIVTVLRVDLQCFQLHIVLTFTLELNCCSSKVYSLKKKSISFVVLNKMF